MNSSITLKVYIYYSIYKGVLRVPHSCQVKMVHIINIIKNHCPILPYMHIYTNLFIIHYGMNVKLRL